MEGAPMIIPLLARVLTALLGLALSLSPEATLAATKQPSSKGLFVLVYGPLISTYYGCEEPEFKAAKRLYAFDCETGAPMSGSLTTTSEWAAYTGCPVGAEPCSSTFPGPCIANTCGDDDTPNECKGGPRTSDATADPAGQLGDPVERRPGSSSLASSTRSSCA
jgi:hypothetical protein